MNWGRAIFIAAVAIGSAAVAGDFVTEVPLRIERTFIPQGFDTNDSVQILVEGNFENPCYQLGRTDSIVDKESRVIEVMLTAYQYEGKCPPTPVRYHHVFQLGRMPAPGKYEVVDLATKKTVGKLDIAAAQDATPGTDDRLYAPLLDAVLLKQADKNVLLLRGVFSSTCMSLGEVKMSASKQAFVVLPSLNYEYKSSCKVGEFPFEKVIPLTESLPAQSTFLLHVRSMGGQSINKIMHSKPN